MLIKWFERNGGGRGEKVLIIWAWAARPRNGERVETAAERRVAKVVVQRRVMAAAGEERWRHGAYIEREYAIQLDQ